MCFDIPSCKRLCVTRIFTRDMYTESCEDNLRSCCDLMHVFFVLDEYTDSMDAVDARILCDATVRAIEEPENPRPNGENVIGEICRQ